jgi:ABC-type sugar transport system substrate-binding protein
MRDRKRKRQIAFPGAVAAFCLVIAACSSGSSASGTSAGSTGSAAGSGSVMVNVGASASIKLTLPMKIGVFVGYDCASYGEVEDATMVSYAKAHNLDLTFFDSCFDQNKQFDQLQSAIADRKFNVIAVGPVVGTNICHMLSTQAPAADIVVAVYDQQLCNRWMQSGTGEWQPGTLNYISGYDSKQAIFNWFDAIVKQFGATQNVGIIEGVPTDSLHWKIAQVLAQYKTEYPKFNVESIANTDYTAAEGYTAAKTMLAAHPNLTMIISPQSDITLGAARAIAQAGKTKSVKLIDYGGDKAAIALMKQGELALSIPTWPATEGIQVLQALIAMAEGKQVPRVTNPQFEVITPANVNSYTPQY